MPRSTSLAISDSRASAAASDSVTADTHRARPVDAVPGDVVMLLEGRRHARAQRKAVDRAVGDRLCPGNVTDIAATPRVGSCRPACNLFRSWQVRRLPTAAAAAAATASSSAPLLRDAAGSGLPARGRRRGGRDRRLAPARDHLAQLLDVDAGQPATVRDVPGRNAVSRIADGSDRLSSPALGPRRSQSRSAAPW